MLAFSFFLSHDLQRVRFKVIKQDPNQSLTSPFHNQNHPPQNLSVPKKQSHHFFPCAHAYYGLRCESFLCGQVPMLLHTTASYAWLSNKNHLGNLHLWEQNLWLLVLPLKLHTITLVLHFVSVLRWPFYAQRFASILSH